MSNSSKNQFYGYYLLFLPLLQTTESFLLMHYASTRPDWPGQWRYCVCQFSGNMLDLIYIAALVLVSAWVGDHLWTSKPPWHRTRHPGLLNVRSPLCQNSDTKGQTSRLYDAKDRSGGLIEAPFSTPLGGVAFLAFNFFTWTATLYLAGF